MLTERERTLLDALAPTAEKRGIELVTVEVVGAKKAPTIRVYIDCEGGIGFEELSCAQSWINDIMDELDPFPGAYMLEVSSPGIDRPLRTLEHFQRFVGEKAQIVLTSPVESRSKWVGILRGIENDTVLLEVDGLIEKLPFSQIKKARVKGTVDFGA